MLLSLTTFQAFDTTISKVAGDRYRILLNTKQRLWRFLSCHFVSPMLKHVVSHHLSYFYFLSILHPRVLLANVSSFFSALSSLACCCCLPDSLARSTCRITCMLSYLCWSRGIRDWRTTLNNNLSLNNNNTSYIHIHTSFLKSIHHPMRLYTCLLIQDSG